MKKFKRHLITSALPYANGPIHLGHLAGVYVPSNIYTRYLRLKGEDVISVCGSDEHGVPITISAKQRGITPQEVVDHFHALNKAAFEGLGIEFDIFSRTTNKVHYETSSDFFRTLYNKGEFIEKVSEHYYDPEAKQFLADRYITGTCPKCGADRAYGDQCESCGSSLNATDLINPKSTLSGATPILKETKHWYLPLDKYEPFLKQWILEEHKEWKPNVYGQCKSWLDGGLMPRAVSRDLDWGVPVPVEGSEGKVLYVWFDAPIGYISATKELTPDWEKYWKSEDTKMVHFIGKDNIVFHCIMFPAMLHAHGGYILPDNVPANEFLNLEGEKLSTSRNWAVWLHEYLEEFPGKEDVLRYVLCANAPETKDNDFTWKDYQARNNSELVAIYGNFVNRALVLTDKYFENRVPQRGELNDYDRETLAELPKLREKIEYYLDNYKFREALREVMNIARLGNKYLADSEPWKTIKEDKEHTATVLNIALQITANLTLASTPFLPFTAAKLMPMLNHEPFAWDILGGSDLLEAEHKLGKAELLFERIEDSVVDAQVEKLARTKLDNADVQKESSIEPQKEAVSFDDFMKMDIRVATVLEAKRVPKTDKLLEILLDTGIDTRTVVSGIAQHYKPEELIGKQVMILVNLAPRKLKGIESKGMILMAEDSSGKLTLASPVDKVGNGSVIG